LPAIYNCVKDYPLAELALVVSHKKESPGIEWAKEQGIEAFYFRLSDWKAQGKDRLAFDDELGKMLKERGIDLVVMAGWDLVVSKEFLKYFLMRLLIFIRPYRQLFRGWMLRNKLWNMESKLQVAPYTLLMKV